MRKESVWLVKEVMEYYVGGIRYGGKFLKDILYEVGNEWLEVFLVDIGCEYWGYTRSTRGKLLSLKGLEVREVGGSKWKSLKDVVNRLVGVKEGVEVHIVEASMKDILGFGRRDILGYALKEGKSYEVEYGVWDRSDVYCYGSKESVLRSVCYRNWLDVPVKDMRKLGKEVLGLIEKLKVNFIQEAWIVSNELGGLSGMEISKVSGVSVLKNNKVVLHWSYMRAVIEQYVSVVGS